MNSILSLLGFDAAKHSIKTEVLAGLTTFLTMSYILAVNPIILSEAGMDKGAVFSATVIAAAIATLVMAFYAKMPFALASGMGINAFFAYTLVIIMGYTWQQALSAVFVEGVVFILLTIFKVREAIVDSIPLNLRYSISVGIGMFIAFIGLKNGGIVVSSEATMTSLCTWNATSLLAMAGILLGAILLALKVKGALFYTIIIITLIGIPFGVTQIPENFTLVSMPVSLDAVAFKIDFSRFLAFDIDFYIVVFTLLFMDLFDTIGTLIGAATGAGMADKQTGKIHNLNKALMADAIGGIVLLARIPDDSFGRHHQRPVPGRCDDAALHHPHRLHRFHRVDAVLRHHAHDAVHGQHLRGHRPGTALVCTREGSHRPLPRTVGHHVHPGSLLRHEVCGTAVVMED